MSEIDAFPRAVLKHHYPEVPLHGDFTTIQAGRYADVDVLVGGTPCQSFSVAGLRGGMVDARGNLALEYLRLAERLRPRWLVWENVPGVLSSNAGRDFGSLLGGMGQLGYGFAYRVLDAQFFGLAQRRKRVFVVGCLGDWRRAAAVLFEPQSLRGHPAPRRETRQAVANALTERPDRGGGNSEGQRLIAPPITSNPYGDHESREGLLVAYGGNNTAGPIDVATTCNAHGGPSGRIDFESETFVTHSLRADGFDASEDGTGRGTPLVAVHAIQAGALRENPDSGPDGVGVQADVAYTIEARPEVQAVAFDTTQITSRANYSNPQVGDPCHPLASQSHAPAIAIPSAVRRMTPRECERLQGFFDDYTLISYRGKPASDGPRYKALGNSMAVPVMAWIGKRIMLASS